MTGSNVVPYEGPIAILLAWTLGWGTGAVRAFVAMKGWAWFVSGTFGVQELSFIQAWGLIMFVNFATYQLTTDTKNENGPLIAMVSGLITSLVWSLFGLASLSVLAVFL